MKGISTVIATILMLMITIGLSGTAYLYISGAFTQQTQGLEVVDAFCSGGTDAMISFRNVGTSDIVFVGSGGGSTFTNCDTGTPTGNTKPCGSITVARTSGEGSALLQGNDSPIEPGTTATLKDDQCTTSGNPRSCVYRITPPSGRSIVATVSCSG